MASEVRQRVDGAWVVPGASQTGHRVAYAVTDASGAVWVHIDGDVIVHETERPRTRRRAAGADDLEAPMPAQVTAVLVEPGDEVIKGQSLVLLDAMKMELPLRAPFAARVEAVHCAAGERVAPGRALVDLTALEATS